MTNALTITAPDGVPFVDFERQIDAPIAAVFNAYKDPELVKQWLGPNGYEMEVERYDFTTGGGYRYVHRGPDGDEYTFNGVFHVVRENEFAIQTFEFEGVPGVVSIESITFDDLDGASTRIRVHAVYPSLEARDGMVASGMEHGVREGFERLDALVAHS
jgi:uncharacterized protein YndB with AHSA1/START domain